MCEANHVLGLHVSIGTDDSFARPRCDRDFCAGWTGEMQRAGSPAVQRADARRGKGPQFDLLKNVPEIHVTASGGRLSFSVQPVQACLTGASSILLGQK